MKAIVRNPLHDRLASGQANIMVVGLGYVGLPLAVAMASAGLKVTGIDIDSVHVAQINSMKSPIADVADEQLAEAIEGHGFQATEELGSIEGADAVIVCVPTPLTKMKTPDLSAVESATAEVAKRLSPGQLIVLESTTYPGTTEEVVLPMLEQTGLQVGEDFFLAFSPERVDPGNREFGLDNTPKLVGGVTDECTRAALTLYGRFVHEVIAVSSPKVAELSKLFENVFRNVNIALVHELAVLCDKMKINTWEVIEAAASKPFGFTKFTTGPGVGGHCIPIDPYYLAAKAKEFDFHSRFIELSGEINENRPYYVVERISEILNERSMSIRDANLLILGVTYKKDVDDLRESPVVKILDILRKRGANIFYNDPHVPKLRHNDVEMASTDLSHDFLRAMDAVIIGTDHSAFNYPEVIANTRLLIDTRNRLKSSTAGPHVVWV